MTKSKIRGNPNKYGLTYQGSKYKLIPTISKYFPKADHFYDLFGGGFSVTHFMAERKSNNYKQFHFNEIRTGICELIKDAIAGKYNYEVFKPEWIDRERFFKEKETNAYIKILWSFGNNGKYYIFGEHLESQKRSMHQAVIFNEFDEFMVETFGIDKWPKGLSILGKRFLLKAIIRKQNVRMDFQRLEQLEQLERLQRLQRLQRLEQKIKFTNLDYRVVPIESNSVIYCDIPYKGTVDYGSEFDHNAFFEWANAQQNPVFISEYNVSDKRFTLIKEIQHRTTFSPPKKDSGTVERLYGNRAAIAKLNGGGKTNERLYANHAALIALKETSNGKT